MSVKNCIKRIVVLLAMIVVVTTSVSLGVFAEQKPMETAKSIEIELNDDYFNPKDITIPNGKTTMLILKNKGTKEHTFTVEELKIDEEIQPGKEITISVNPEKSGTYELICRYHFREGMVGKIIVN